MKARVTAFSLSGLEKYKSILSLYNLTDLDYAYFAGTKQLSAGTININKIEDIKAISHACKRNIVFDFATNSKYDFNMNIC